ncbi:hypothetical protein NKW53_11965 [Acetobacter orientalis]|uniref:hypothetical protein n=1 Tax=Acetobacter orientalis TaxID=146474 RepID=UPI0020A0B6F5|nr:hypothetical protein [Acetobacter orientalis]MCP1216781.1 hypothetical protein [Acetobacter orientalis]MCP1219508.1 hypothetical protein [Acetobacter orientalis]
MTVPYSAQFLAAIKTATKTAVQVVGDFRAAAGFTRVQETQLHAYTNRNQPSVVPMDVAIDLDHCAEKPIHLMEMAHALGYVVLPSHIGPGDFGKDMGEFALSSGDILATAVRVLDDGRIDPAEAHEIGPKLMQGKHILERALATIHKVQTDNKPYVVSGREAV